jgi:hypothetical protein
MISDLTLASLRRTANTSLQDTCVRRAYTRGRDANNQETESWADAETFPCRYHPAGGASSGQAGSRETTAGTVVDRDSVRLPLAAAGVFTSRDRIKITALRGVALARPIERSIRGDVDAGLNTVLMRLTGVHA